MSLVVLEAGLLTTVQDLGRIGSRSSGVVSSGAADPAALRTANVLIGNEPWAAGLELTLTGGVLRFEQDVVVALCGAAMDARAEGGPPLPAGRPVLVRGGTALRLGAARSGVRAYLAVAGGLAVPAVLGSRSTHVRARLGGLAGRALQAGDRLPAGPPPAAAAALAGRLAAAAVPGAALTPAPWALSPRTAPGPAQRGAPGPGGAVRLRAVRGPEAQRFEAESLEAFFARPYRVSAQADRMGCRLEGEPLRLRAAGEMLSEAVVPGTVQVPAGGQPIALLADAQTTGGYPRIAQIAAVDLPLLAQARAGTPVRFEEIPLAEAQALYLLQELAFRRLEAAVRARIESL
ncbi:biotin-dependent carboxyltransferase family protein [Paenibacillus mucilaginosus]|uniref:5-oxoprolinase subunit C family protein n=1 Tax=Paenibacillus mucilaginosus TaxID=61624 RepID=UPI002379C05B|nr:biotin-dependent carboxyltransferase family protein [Paenibacillus mucilaginosus]WDM26828.1 biotin-dependent carboxyltransferase [Paenibacillus mucilaginosus]